jgi:hypothetical protein
LIGTKRIGSGNGLADGLGISCIVLVGLDIRLDELRRHQSHGVAHRLDLARPVVCAATGLHPDQARRKIREEHSNLVSAQLLLHEHLAALVDCVNLKHILGQVNADSRNLHGERSFSVQVVDQRLHCGTSMPLRVGAFIPLLTVHSQHALKPDVAASSAGLG